MRFERAPREFVNEDQRGRHPVSPGLCDLAGQRGSIASRTTHLGRWFNGGAGGIGIQPRTQARPTYRVSIKGLRLFKILAARCTLSMRSQFDDMRDCRCACRGLADVLKDRGFSDATMIGCSVFLGNRDGMLSRTGEFEATESPARSVVLVRGCLIGATAGQFRCDKVQIPDYLVLPRRIALSILETTCRWMEKKVEGLCMYSVKNGGERLSNIIRSDRSGFRCQEVGRTVPAPAIVFPSPR
jgi:hypothetical protein